LTLVYCQLSDVIACADAYVVECEKLGTLLDLQLCREYKKTLIFRRTSCFFLQDPFLVGCYRFRFCSEYKLQCTLRHQLEIRVDCTAHRPEESPGEECVNALTKDFLPSYDKLLVALCPILESILPRIAPEQPIPRTDFPLFVGQYTPPCKETEASLPCS